MLLRSQSSCGINRGSALRGHDALVIRGRADTLSVLFLDSDSIIRPGFHAEVAAKMAPQEVWSATKTPLVMNRFELRNPFPPLKGFRTRLPHLGNYHYDTENSWMFNSGLIGASPVHVPLLEDTLAFIDALIGRARKFITVEQFAISEVARLSQTPIAEVRDSFLHYWQGRRRVYMSHVIERDLSPNWDDLTPPAAWAKMGGASPVNPTSMEPTFRPSSSCGPAGNSSHCTLMPCAARRLSSDPRALSTTKLPYF